MSGTIFGYDYDTVVAFDKAYRLSLPPAVRALLDMDPTQPQRLQLAQALAGKGYLIDVVIQVWGMDPYMTMTQRLLDGYSTFPDALNATQINVSNFIADYPPYPVPVPVVDPGSVYIGAEIGSTLPYVGSFWFATVACVKAALPDGFTMSMGGRQYILHVIQQQMPAGSLSQAVYRWTELT